jgi:phosphatidylserine/phosphatidylglycerophosphate/cardiolipin synthase-like enzyme
MTFMFAEFQVSTGFLFIAWLAIVLQGLILLRSLFGPKIKYKIASAQPQRLDSEEFLGTLEALTDAKVNRRVWLDVFTNGEGFYQAELQAIRNAKRSVNLEAYIFQTGQITRLFVDALTERARAGVKVNVVLDGLGSLGTRQSYFKDLCAAGGKVAWYHPVRWHTGELVRAIRERGISVQIIAPGKHSDRMLTRSSSRRAYGRLLKAGAEIYEYGPTMIHAKILTIDGLWSVVGSTNCDNRSFGLNDEVNLAAKSQDFTARLEQDFARDLANSHRVTYPEWVRRPLVERAPELLGWVLERQQ